MEIVKATLKHLDDLVPLFNGYRMFYRQSSNIEAARSFLNNRIQNNESVIYIAYLNNKAVGFYAIISIILFSIYAAYVFIKRFICRR